MASIPVATVEPRASAELDESEPDDGAVLHHPAEVVAGAVTRRPERTEVPVVVDVPLAPGRSTPLDVCGPALRLEDLGRTVREHQLASRQRPGDEFRCDHVAVRHLEVIEPVHGPTVAVRGVMYGWRPLPPARGVPDHRRR